MCPTQLRTHDGPASKTAGAEPEGVQSADGPPATKFAGQGRSERVGPSAAPRGRAMERTDSRSSSWQRGDSSLFEVRVEPVSWSLEVRSALRSR